MVRYICQPTTRERGQTREGPRPQTAEHEQHKKENAFDGVPREGACCCWLLARPFAVGCFCVFYLFLFFSFSLFSPFWALSSVLLPCISRSDAACSCAVWMQASLLVFVSVGGSAEGRVGFCGRQATGRPQADHRRATGRPERVQRGRMGLERMLQDAMERHAGCWAMPSGRRETDDRQSNRKHPTVLADILGTTPALPSTLFTGSIRQTQRDRQARRQTAAPNSPLQSGRSMPAVPKLHGAGPVHGFVFVLPPWPLHVCLRLLVCARGFSSLGSSMTTVVVTLAW